MKSSDEIGEIAAALAAAQGKMDHASKDRSNPAFKSRYADLASVLDACRPHLSEHAIAIIQPPAVVLVGEAGPGVALVRVETRLIHKSGQWFGCSLEAAVADVKAQTIGSAITYLRRYGLSAMAGIAPDDDDGNRAQGHARPEAPPEPRHEPARPQVTPQQAGEIVRAKLPYLADAIAALVERQDLSDAAKLDELRRMRDSAKAQDPGLLLQARKLVTAATHASKDEQARIAEIVADYTHGSGRVEDIGPGDLGGFIGEVSGVLNERVAA